MHFFRISFPIFSKLQFSPTSTTQISFYLKLQITNICVFFNIFPLLFYTD